MTELLMELRRVDPTERVVVGRVAPYDEVSYLTPHIEGERIIRGAFNRSIHHRRKNGIPLLKNHDTGTVMGYSTSFDDGDDGLVGTFKINEGDIGDRFLDEVRDGYMKSLSVGFRPVRHSRGADGVREVREAQLVEVSMVGIPAYAGAEMIAVRSAEKIADLPDPFKNPVELNLDPYPSVLYRHLQ